MSCDRVPYKSEVMGWSPQQLAEYLKTMSVPGCDKIVLKNNISGSRFVNLSDSDLQKFPKLHAPMVSKICNDICKNEGKRGLFSKKPTSRYQEPETTPDAGWDEDEFDDVDDYESPYSDNDASSGGDYESPNDDAAGDYEPPPSEPSEDHKLCPSQPIGDGDYIDRRDNHMSTRGPPPVLCPRPPVATLSAQMPGESSSRRDLSPHRPAQLPGKFPPEPPKVFRENKPGANPSRSRGSHSSTLDRLSGQSWRPQAEAPDPPSWSKPPAVPPPSSSFVSRSNSSARASPSRLDGRRETQDEALKHNTFPLHKSLPPRPGIPGAAGRPADSMSLPHKLHSDQRSSTVGSDRQAFRPPPATVTPAQVAKDLDSRWYVGRVTRGQAEGCLRHVSKDGAYLVRDSTRQQPNQPFTLMVYYQEKVYNIQIRQQNQQYQLGTGLKAQESFPSVSDIIIHYSQSPLLLIDAKNRTASQQNQCLLSDPAGYYMTGQI